MVLNKSQKINQWLIKNVSNKPLVLLISECCKKFKVTKIYVTKELQKIQKASPKEIKDLKSFEIQLSYILSNLTDTELLLDCDLRDSLGYGEKPWRKIRSTYIDKYVIKIKNKYMWSKKFLIDFLNKRYNNQ